MASLSVFLRLLLTFMLILKTATAAPQMDMAQDVVSDTEVKNTCAVTKVLVAMKDMLLVLSSEVRQLRDQVANRCPEAVNANHPNVTSNTQAMCDSSEQLVGVTDARIPPESEAEMQQDAEDNKTSTETNNSQEEENTLSSTLQEVTSHESATEPPATQRPAPSWCKSPFSLIGGGCYIIKSDSHEWATWGDAQSVCQGYGGRLATPWRFDELRDYLSKHYSDAFWVGVKYNKQSKSWDWLTGQPVEASVWKVGNPKQAAKNCVYLESWAAYRASNHYCGEKYPYICQEWDDTQ